MGLDVAFHDGAGNELLCLRNHCDFFSLFQPRREDIRAPHDDFSVSVKMLEAVLEKIDAEIADAGAPLRTPPPSDGSGESILDVPTAAHGLAVRRPRRGTASPRTDGARPRAPIPTKAVGTGAEVSDARLGRVRGPDP